VAKEHSLRPEGNLPVEVTSFVGRRSELAEARRLLSSSRLLTLTGPGGVGKTRLALHLASDLRRAFDDGVWFVDLGTLSDAALLTDSVGLALGVMEAPAGWPLTLLCEHLRDKAMLLVLDNCEHMRVACAVLVDAVLQAASQVRIVVTSRHSMALPAEQIMVVSPLPVPDLEQQLKQEVLSEYDSVRLFTERAAAAVSNFALTAENAEAVAELCNRLDGLPLAIELAAARLRVLSPQQVLERLDVRFPLLAADNPTAAPRQQTLQALIDWSFDLCSPDERKLWERASVFGGSFDLEAVEQICSGDGLEPGDILDLVTGLVAKSILLREDDGPRVRYRLLHTLREYGGNRLAQSGTEAVARMRHLDYYQRLAGQATAAWFGPDMLPWLELLRAEHSNLRLALEYCVGDPNLSQDGFRMASTLWVYWRSARRMSEGRRWLDRLLEVDPAPTPPRAKALWVDAWLAIYQSDLNRADELLSDSEALGTALGDEAVLRHVTTLRGEIALAQGDLPAAVAILEGALPAHREGGEPLALGLTLVRLALALSALGETARALELLAEHVKLCRSSRALFAEANCLWAMAVVKFETGDLAESTALATESLKVLWAHADWLGAALNMEVLSWAAAAEGNMQRAGRLLGTTHHVWQVAGGPLMAYGQLGAHRERCTTIARRRLGDKAFEVEFDRGAQMSFHTAAAYALNETEVPPATASDAAAGPLTQREEEIAVLVANGMSNRAIAQALVISQRTAEGHVGHILTKLGFSSRAQIASWATERKLD
jgi:predicted ATPase/DNA-binding CsgD family transcriptional regulator